MAQKRPLFSDSNDKPSKKSALQEMSLQRSVRSISVPRRNSLSNLPLQAQAAKNTSLSKNESSTFAAIDNQTKTSQKCKSINATVSSLKNNNVTENTHGSKNFPTKKRSSKSKRNNKNENISKAVDDDDNCKLDNWVQCTSCGKWRCVYSVNIEIIPKHWYCKDNPDENRNTCEAPKESEEEVANKNRVEVDGDDHSEIYWVRCKKKMQQEKMSIFC